MTRILAGGYNTSRHYEHDDIEGRVVDMGVRILAGKEGHAALYCSTSGFAFGPIFESEDYAQVFLWWLGHDPRDLSDGDLESKYGAFLSFMDKWGTDPVFASRIDAENEKDRQHEAAQGKETDGVRIKAGQGLEEV